MPSFSRNASGVVACATCATGLFSFASSSQAEWQRLPSLPEPSSGFVCGTSGRDLVILGGTTWRGEQKAWLDTIWLFDTRKGKWLRHGSLPGPLAYAAYGQSDGQLFWCGGSDGEKTLQRLCRFAGAVGPDVCAENVPAPVYAGSAALDSKLYVLGGASDPNALNTLSNRFLAVDVGSGAYRVLPPPPGDAALIPCLIALNDQVFAFGGASWIGDGIVSNRNVASSFSITKRRWSSVREYPFPVRGLAGCALDERYLLLAGGYRFDPAVADAERFTNEAFLYDTRDNRYLKTKSLPYGALVALVKSGDFLFCLGGEDRKRHRTDAVYRILCRELLPAR